MGLLSWLGGGSRPRDTARGAAGPAADARPEPAPPVAGWRDLPPIQRLTEGFGPVTDPAGFRDSLDTWRDTSLTGALGHLVTPQAPTGLMHDVAVPAPPTTGHREVPHSVRDFGTPRTAAPQTAPAVPLQRFPAETPLTSAAPPAEPPLRQLAGLPLAPPRPIPEDVTPATTATTRDPQTPQAPTLPSAPVQRSSAPAAPRPQVVGLGEPLRELPPTAQREPAARSVPASAPPDVPPAPPEPADGESGEPSRPLLADDPLMAPPDTPTATPTVPDDPPTRSTASPSPTVPSPAAPWPAVPVQRLATSGAPPLVPPSVVPPGPSPVTPSATSPDRVVPLVTQRTLPRYSSVPAVPAPAAEPQVVPLRWSAPPDPGTPASPTGGRDAAPAVQMSAGPMGPVRSVQLVAVAAPGPPSAVTGSPGSPAADAGSVAVASGIARRAADGSVVFRTTVSEGPSHSVQRDADVPEPSPVSSPEAPGTVAEPAPATVVGSTAPPGGGGTPAQPSDDAPPKVSDELVRALFTPLSRLLKAELRLDRERAGFLINTRH